MKGLMSATPAPIPEGRDSVRRFLVGADPEMAYVTHRRDSGRGPTIGRARDLFTCVCASEIDRTCRCASRWVSEGGVMGTDGCSTIFEARPHPAVTPNKLVRNLGIILNQTQKVLPQGPHNQTDMVCGPYHLGFSLGGHVHFGVERLQDSRFDVEREFLTTGRSETPICAWCGATHNIAVGGPDQWTTSMSAMLSPLLSGLEGEPGRERRYGSGASNGNYGQTTRCVRVNNHGFEYRTPGCWLSSPTHGLVAVTLVRAAFKLVSGEVGLADQITSDREHGVPSLDRVYRRPATARSEVLQVFNKFWAPYWNRLTGNELVALQIMIDRCEADTPFKVKKVRDAWPAFEKVLDAWQRVAQVADDLLHKRAKEAGVPVVFDYTRDLRDGTLRED